MAKMFGTRNFKEIKEMIFINLDTKSIIVCRLVNQEFKSIIDNPTFYLRKFSYDSKGFAKRLGKAFSTMVEEEERIRNTFSEYKVRDRIDLSCPGPKSKLIQAYGQWNLTIGEMSNESPEIFLNRILLEFLDQSRQVINNPSSMNYKLEHNPTISLMKVHGVINKFNNIFTSNEMFEAAKEDFWKMMTKKGKWKKYCEEKQKLPYAIYETFHLFLKLTSLYMPTLICYHCQFSSTRRKQQCIATCSRCKQLREVLKRSTNPYTNPSETIAALNHIKDLCFQHRKELVNEFTVSMIDMYHCIHGIMGKMLRNEL